MADLRTAGAVLQTVHQGGSGATFGTSAAFLQAVTTSIGGHVRSPYAALQIVSSSTGSRVRESYTSLQVVLGTGGGGRSRALHDSMQVVYTLGFEDLPLKRAWTFEFDGHVFYCLDLGNTGTLVYDLTTKQWSVFDTTGYNGAFNFKNGIYWRTGRRIVGGDAESGNVYEMEPDTFLDEGWRPVSYEVRGILFAEGVDVVRQYALRLIGSAGRLADDISPVLNMKFSDDEGASWSNEYSITLTTDSKQRLEFRSLGAFAAPGRVFRLYDTGGVKFIGRCEADVDGAG